MKSKLLHGVVSLIVFAGLSAVFIELTWQPHVQAAEETEHEQEQEGVDEHAGHEAAAPRSVEEMLATPCEHDVPIVECDECRYEAGVAKISPQIADGLVETWPVHTESQATTRLNLTGEVQLDLTRVAEVASAGTGRVDQVHKYLGDRVEAGEVVAVVQSSDLGEAQAGLLEARARLDLARQTFEREKQLHERKISSQADYLAAGSELASAEAAVAGIRKRLQLFGLSDDRIESLVAADSDASFGQLALATPIAGTVLEQNVVRGQLVDPSNTLYRIADLSRVWVWCDLYEADLAALHERMAAGSPVQAQVHSAAFPQTVFAGTLDVIGSQLDRETRTLKVRVVVDNPDGRLKPGMFVRVSVGLGDERPVLRIPATAVLSDEGKQFVFTRFSDELWVRRDVTAGPARDGFVEVLAGLKDGDVVAAKGAFMFKSEVLKEKMGAGCAH